MAKINAYGDREVLRWTRDEDGAELVLTARRRLLWKSARGGTFKLLQAGTSRRDADMHAAERCMDGAPAGGGVKEDRTARVFHVRSSGGAIVTVVFGSRSPVCSCGYAPRCGHVERAQEMMRP